MERMTVASAVRYNHTPFEYYDELQEHADIDKRSYLTVAKLTAILQLANALDKGKKDKIKKMKAYLKGGELHISVNTDADLLFERERFGKKAVFFEEVFGIRPVIDRKEI